MRESVEGLCTIATERPPARRIARLGWLIGFLALVGLWSLSAHAGPFGAGPSHTCMRTATGGVQCAGTNRNGELGDGTAVASTTPVNVTGLSSGVSDVTAGGQDGFDAFGCALTDAGGVKCWGSPFSNGSINLEPTPFDVPGLASGVTAIAAGGNHACAITAGGVKCWGLNGFGQLGDSTNTDSATPVDVQGLGAGSGVTAIAAGISHTCAALATGIRCWGLNTSGQLGNGNTTSSTIPVVVSGFATAAASLAAGSAHTCAVNAGGGAQCWGNNFRGQLGFFTGVDQNPAPVNVSGLGTGVAQIASGFEFTCALTDTGAIKCWGYSWNGEFGNGNHGAFDFSPQDVPSLQSGVTAVFVGAGSSHVCAALDNGAIECWGRNDTGQLGNGTTTARLLPTDVAGLGSGVSMVAVDRDSSCALTAGGGVKCWGRNEFTGQVGDASTINKLTPVDVSGLTSGVSAITVGGRHACALMSGTNGVKCWGRGTEGQLGNGTFSNTQSTPVDVTGLTSNVSAIAAGFLHTCALTDTAGVKCWGQDTFGQLGNDAPMSNLNLAADVAGLTSGASAIAAGFQHSCAVLTGGGVRCWGSNGNGRLGDGSTTNSPTPVDVSGLGAAISTVGTGTAHTCAKTTTGGIKCWGRSSFGELGNGTFIDNPLPGDVSGLTSGVSQLAVGRSTSCALTTGGGLKCWGNNGEGAVGDGTMTDRPSPVDVAGLTSGVASITETGLHTCAVTSGGGVKCWGQNLWGQIGDGTNFGVTFPLDSLFTFRTTAGSGLAQAPPLPPPPPSSGLAGSSVAVAPGMVVLGAPESTVAGETGGQVFVYFDPSAPPGALVLGSEREEKSGFIRKATADFDLAILQVPTPLTGDKFGQVAVSHDRSTVVVGAPGVSNDRGAIYIFQEPVGGWGGTVMPSQTLVPPASIDDDLLGATVTMTNAGTVLIGAPGASVSNLRGAGKVFVIRPLGDGSFALAETLTSPDPQFGALFGAAIDGDGAEAVIGSPNHMVAGESGRGAVVSFRESTSGGPYAAPDLIVDAAGSIGDKFGTAVAIFDGTLVVGAPGHDNPGAADAGAAVIFDQSSAGDEVPIATLTQPNAEAGAGLGTTVAAQDEIIAAGAPFADVNGNVDQGSVAIHVLPAPGFPLAGALKPTALLFDPFGNAGDHFGAAFALSASIAAAGVPYHQSAAQKRAAPKARAGLVPPGQAIAYTDDVTFRDGLESPRGLVDGCIAPDLAIPDNSATGVNSSITLTAAGDVRDVNVYVRIAHPFSGDLRLTLTHVPTGRTLPLYTPAGTCPTADIEVEFDDQALGGYAKDKCSGATPAVTGVRLPNDWLLRMQGAARAGPWQLTVADVKATDSGTLQQWCVEAR